MNPENLKIEETPEIPEKPEKGYPIERICSHCKKILGFKDGGKEPGEQTHDICPECFKKEHGIDLVDHGIG